VYN
jgi:hypothetical protein